MTNAWPTRHRLYGGRNTHASRPTDGTPYGMTACRKPIAGNDRPQFDDAAITCRACLKEINR